MDRLTHLRPLLAHWISGADTGRYCNWQHLITYSTRFAFLLDRLLNLLNWLFSNSKAKVKGVNYTEILVETNAGFQVSRSSEQSNLRSRNGEFYSTTLAKGFNTAMGDSPLC